MPKLVSCVVIILSWIGLPVKGEEHKEWFQLSGIKESQSPLPVGGGTKSLCVPGLRRRISIHPPREGRDVTETERRGEALVFQSTLPVRGGTFSFLLADCRKLSFQSTLPARGGTPTTRCKGLRRAISIHPPREGRDLQRIRKTRKKRDFNPPSP